MKFRTDFVTNSSSSSFVAIHLKSQPLADFFSERMEEIEENNDGFCDVEVNVEGDDVSIECGDSDVPFFDAPRSIDDAVSMLMEICHLETNDSEPEELAETIEEIEWSSETMGLDGDDGRFDQDNYDPDVLEGSLE